MSKEKKQKLDLNKLKEKIESVGQDLNREANEAYNESNKDMFQGKFDYNLFSYKRKYNRPTRNKTSYNISKTFYK